MHGQQQQHQPQQHQHHHAQLVVAGPPQYSSIVVHQEHQDCLLPDDQQQQQRQGQQHHVMFARTTTTTTTKTTTVIMDEEQQPLLAQQQQQPLHHSASSASVASSTASAASPLKSSSSSWSSCCSLRRWALELSLYLNLIICLAKLIAYLKSLSLSVLAALVDSVLDVVSQLVLYYTERHSTFQRRSSALYPAGASRLEPIGVLTCAALMGMASFEVIKESVERLLYFSPTEEAQALLNYNMASVWSMIAIVAVKLGLWVLCKRAARNHVDVIVANAAAVAAEKNALQQQQQLVTNNQNMVLEAAVQSNGNDDKDDVESSSNKNEKTTSPYYSFMTDPTLEALAQDHWNDTLSNLIAALALISALRYHSLWFLDPVGAILISIYIIHSWYHTGKEQIEQLTGRGAPDEFIDELLEIANSFDDRMIVDVCRAYHFGPKFLVELEVVLPKDTLLFESHDLGMELQYEIEGRPEVERCFVHIDYETRPYDEHVVSKVPGLREKYQRANTQSTRSTRSL